MTAVWAIPSRFASPPFGRLHGRFGHDRNFEMPNRESSVIATLLAPPTPKPCWLSSVTFCLPLKIAVVFGISFLGVWRRWRGAPGAGPWSL